jgi:hypothetical protein
MKTLFPLRLLAAAAALAAGASADTILLKDGTTLQGRVVREEGDNYVLEVQVTKSIRDERKVPKTSIAKITSETNDEKPYQELVKLFPVPELATVEDYDNLLRNHFDPFLKAHGTSKHYREVRDIRAKIAAEREVVAAGGIKFGGRLINAADRKADAIDIDAAATLQAMKSAAEAGNYLAALRSFSDLERGFPGTNAQTEGAELAKKVLNAFRLRLTAQLNELPARLKQRELSLERMDAPERERAKEMFARQQKAYDTRIARERQDGVKWLTVAPDRRESIEEALRQVETERTRLQTPAATQTAESPAAAYREAWQKLGSASPEEAKTILENFKRFQVPARYLTLLEERAAAAKP